MPLMKAQFDGKVFVPDRPIDLQPGSVTLQVIESDMDIHPLSALPVLRVPPDGKRITSDDVRHALEDI
jgi:hypothetical protein